MPETSDPYELIKKAESEASRAKSANKAWISALTRGGDFELAVEYYDRAGTQFKKRDMPKEGAESYEKAAEIQRDYLGGGYGMADACMKASLCYRLIDRQATERVLKLAIDGFTSANRFQRAATTQRELAKLYEEDVQGDEKQQHDSRQKVIEAYELCAKWFDEENAMASGSQDHQKAAELAALNGDYQKAIYHFELMAQRSVKNNLNRFSAKNHFFKAGICHMAARDTIGVRRALNEYVELDPGFAKEREFQLLQNLVDRIENNDADGFSEHLLQFDRIYPMDNWKTAILLRVKDGIGPEAEDFY